MNTFSVEFEGVEDLNAQFEKLKSEYGKVSGDVVCEVSFSTNYGFFVHEDLEASHTVGESKFLEKAAERKKEEVADYVERMIASTNFSLALYGGGTIIQRQAQKLVPIDTGALRASARTELSRGVNS